MRQVLLPLNCFAAVMLALVRRQPSADLRVAFLKATLFWAPL
jgi:hypothetical protein